MNSEVVRGMLHDARYATLFIAMLLTVFTGMKAKRFIAFPWVASVLIRAPVSTLHFGRATVAHGILYPLVFPLSVFSASFWHILRRGLSGFCTPFGRKKTRHFSFVVGCGLHNCSLCFVRSLSLFFDRGLTHVPTGTDRIFQKSNPMKKQGGLAVLVFAIIALFVLVFVFGVANPFALFNRF